jgi:hypothetical protein
LLPWRSFPGRLAFPRNGALAGLGRLALIRRCFTRKKLLQMPSDYLFCVS